MPDEDDGARPVPGSDASFSENVTAAGGVKAATDEALGDLLSQLERLRYGQLIVGAVSHIWMPSMSTRRATRPMSTRITVWQARGIARQAVYWSLSSIRSKPYSTRPWQPRRMRFGNGDPSEAVRLYDLAVAITPGHREAEAGLERAKNLDSVLSLMEQGIRYEDDLELDAAKLAYENALSIDPLWEPASLGLERIKDSIKNLSFVQRMTEGFDALYGGDFDTARAAFNAAKLLNPDSREPADGLLQVDQEVRLADIRRMEDEANKLNAAEQWESSIATYQDILKIDPDLQFAHEGLAMARSRAAIHSRLQEFIDDPDSLSEDATMQNATRMLLDITRVDPMGPRLEDQKSELARLLKRAATPLRGATRLGQSNRGVRFQDWPIRSF